MRSTFYRKYRALFNENPPNFPGLRQSESTNALHHNALGSISPRYRSPTLVHSPVKPAQYAAGLPKAGSSKTIPTRGRFNTLDDNSRRLPPITERTPGSPVAAVPRSLGLQTPEERRVEFKKKLEYRRERLRGLLQADRVKLVRCYG